MGILFSFAGRVLTDSNILSVDGNLVSTQTHRTSQNDHVDRADGTLTGGTATVGTVGRVSGTAGTGITYVFSVNAVTDVTTSQQQGNVLVGRHYYLNITTTSPTYSTANGNVLLCVGSTGLRVWIEDVPFWYYQSNVC